MKKSIKYFCLLFFLGAAVFFDSFFSFGFRVSLLVCVSFSVFNADATSIAASAAAGLLCDMLSLTLPYFSLLYLYISLGCVWCRGMVVSLSAKTASLVGFIGFFAFDLLAAEFFVNSEFILLTFLRSLTGAIGTALFYFAFKRLRF